MCTKGGPRRVERYLRALEASGRSVGKKRKNPWSQQARKAKPISRTEGDGGTLGGKDRPTWGALKMDGRLENPGERGRKQKTSNPAKQGKRGDKYNSLERDGIQRGKFNKTTNSGELRYIRLNRRQDDTKSCEMQ